MLRRSELVESTEFELAQQLTDQQYLHFPQMFDPDLCRALGDKIIQYKSLAFKEDQHITDDIRLNTRKISLGSFFVKDRFPEIVDFTNMAVDAIQDLGIVNRNWGNIQKIEGKSALGHQSLPGGGYYLHRDADYLVDAVAVIGMKGMREFTIVPSSNPVVSLKPQLDDQSLKVILDEGDLMLLDCFSNPWHQTINISEDEISVSLTLAQPHQRFYV